MAMTMRSSFAARVAGPRPAVRAVRPSARTVSVNAFKVTFKTPSGDKVVEVADDVYILDAAEVRRSSVSFFSNSINDDKQRIRTILLDVTDQLI